MAMTFGSEISLAPWRLRSPRRLSSPNCEPAMSRQELATMARLPMAAQLARGDKFVRDACRTLDKIEPQSVGAYLDGLLVRFVQCEGP